MAKVDKNWLWPPKIVKNPQNLTNPRQSLTTTCARLHFDLPEASASSETFLPILGWINYRVLVPILRRILREKLVSLAKLRPANFFWISLRWTVPPSNHQGFKSWMSVIWSKWAQFTNPYDSGYDPHPYQGYDSGQYGHGQNHDPKIKKKTTQNFELWCQGIFAQFIVYFKPSRGEIVLPGNPPVRSSEVKSGSGPEVVIPGSTLLPKKKLIENLKITKLQLNFSSRSVAGTNTSQLSGAGSLLQNGNIGTLGGGEKVVNKEDGCLHFSWQLLIFDCRSQKRGSHQFANCSRCSAHYTACLPFKKERIDDFAGKNSFLTSDNTQIVLGFLQSWQPEGWTHPLGFTYWNRLLLQKSKYISSTESQNWRRSKR